ncbi:MAG: hypothetical protein U0636_11940 [Phycisphaerales bacterium]
MSTPISTPLQPPDRVRTLASAVAAVAPVARELAAQLDATPPIQKPDDTPVTVADFVLQAVLVHTLRQQLGAAHFINEESATSLLTSGRPDVVRVFWRAGAPAHRRGIGRRSGGAAGRATCWPVRMVADGPD